MKGRTVGVTVWSSVNVSRATDVLRGRICFVSVLFTNWFFSLFMGCLRSDLISRVFPALPCCLFHLWSHPEGWCWTESVPLHVGHTRYVHLVNASTRWRCVVYTDCLPVVFSMFVSRPQCMAWSSRGGEPGGSEGPAQSTKQTLVLSWY